MLGRAMLLCRHLSDRKATCVCRYYGVNDPVAEKMLGQLDEMPKLVPPEDTTITTLYVGGLTPDITEQHIKDQFYGHGEIMSVRKVSGPHLLPCR